MLFPWPGRPDEERDGNSDGHSEASLGVQAEGVQACLTLAGLTSPETQGLAWILVAGYLSSSELRDVEGVAGRRVGGDLRLEPMDVAAVAEQMTFQWITAVALLII